MGLGLVSSVDPRFIDDNASAEGDHASAEREPDVFYDPFGILPEGDGVIHGEPPEEQSYEDCIFNRMDGVESDMAARAIAAACRERYPEPVNRFEFVD